MSIRKIRAILKKQLKDSLKNKEVLIQFLMFPLLTVILNNLISIPDMPQNYFVHLFATMYIGMAPLTSMAAIIAEEKDSNTLRVLMMSNVRAGEYLAGEGIFVTGVCMLGACVFGVQGGYQGMEFVRFIGLMFFGIVTSTMVGAAIGIWSRNQMAATSVTVPLMMVLSFVPMIAAFNQKIRSLSEILYTGQLSYLFDRFAVSSISAGRLAVILVNAAVAALCFFLAYKKRGLL